MDNEALDTHLIRVAKGNPSAAELAALTAVLLARVAHTGAEPDDVSRGQRAVARWRRPERVRGFTGPRTWQADTWQGGTWQVGSGSRAA